MAEEHIANGHENGDAAGEGEAIELNEQEYAWLQEQLARLNREGAGGDTEDAEEWQDPTGGPLSELLAATEEGDAERVAQAVQGRSWDINTPGPDGDTALHLACLYGHEDCVKALLDAGAAADCVNAQDGSTTLHDAAAGGYLSICELLLAKAGDGLVKVAGEERSRVWVWALGWRFSGGHADPRGTGGGSQANQPICPNDTGYQFAALCLKGQAYGESIGQCRTGQRGKGRMVSSGWPSVHVSLLGQAQQLSCKATLSGAAQKGAPVRHDRVWGTLACPGSMAAAGMTGARLPLQGFRGQLAAVQSPPRG